MVNGCSIAPRDFAGNERGSVSILFAIVMFAVIFAAGVAVDYARAVHLKSRINAAADAAALAAGRALLDNRMSDSEIVAMAEQFFTDNLEAGGNGFGTVDQLNIQLDRANGNVTIDVAAEVPMTLTQIGGFEKTEVPVHAAVTFKQTDVELGMALDVTGSMSGQKLVDLKLAAKDLIDIMLPDGGTPNKVRIGLAPYAAAVNAGGYANVVSGGKSKDKCVLERTGAEAYSDAVPAPGQYFNAGGKPKDIDPKEGVSSYSCPTAKIEPITDDKASLKASIDTYAANGFTAGHFGAAWAWYLISPQWAAIWPAASAPAVYDPEKTVKAIILMTDGIFNTAYNNGTSDNQAKQLCDQMKTKDNKDVIVFSVGFQAPPDAEATLKYCATSSAHYFKASDGNQLRAAFASIAVQLNNLRLTQ